MSIFNLGGIINDASILNLIREANFLLFMQTNFSRKTAKITKNIEFHSFIFDMVYGKDQ